MSTGYKGGNMGLSIVAGRAGTGKSTYIYDDISKEIKKNRRTNLILIVPEQRTYQTELEIIARIREHGIMSVEVLSFTRLAYKIFEEVGNLKVQEINRYGKIMLLKQVFEENRDQLKLFGKTFRQEGFLKEFDNLISELKQNCVSVEFLEQVMKYQANENENNLLNNKLEDIIKIYREIENRTKDSFFDEEDKMNLFISSVEKSEYIKNSIIWIDGFDSFNMQRHRLIKELISYACSVTISLDIDAEALKDPYSCQDWDAFKIIHDTYKILSQKSEELEGHEGEINIIPVNRNKTNAEMQLIERSICSISSETYSKNTSNIHISSSLNPYSETEKAAAEIVSLVREDGYRWKDISIAVGSMDVYGIDIKKVFTQYTIPYFIDYKRDIMGNPLTKFILSLLDMFIYNFRHDSVFEFLKTGFTSLNYDEVSRLENFALQYGIQGEKWFRPFKFNADNIEYFDKLRKKFTAGLKEAKKSFKELKTTHAITMFIFDFLKDYNVQEKIKKQVDIFKKDRQYELSGENAQVWNLIIDIFEQIVLAVDDVEITVREYRKMIEAGFNEIEISIIPPSLDKVTIGEAGKISFKSSKALFILGANEGILDSRNTEKGLLLDDERELLAKAGMKLLNDADYDIYKEKHVIYKLFTSADEKLFLSYAMGTSDGKSMQPSMYADRLKQLFPMVMEQSGLSVADEVDKVSNDRGTVDYLISNIRNYVEGKGMEDLWKDVYAWYEENENHITNLINHGLMHKNKAPEITGENLQEIHTKPVSMSVSKLESFASCPFKLFMENVIKPQPRIVQKIEFYDLGNIYHKSVEEFTKKITENEADEKYIERLDREEVYKLAQICTENVLNEGEMDYTAFDSNERNRYMKEKIKRLVSRAAETIIEQLKRGSFRPAYTELVIGRGGTAEPVELKLNDEVSIYLQGRIDRVDVFKKDDKLYINIIDYKSSHKDIDLSDVVQGLQLQLLVYMSAMIKSGEKMFHTAPEIGGAYYFCIDDPMVDADVVLAENIENELFKQLSLKGYIVEDLDIITGMDSEITTKRKSDIIPVSLNKDGSTSRYSKTLTSKEFKGLLKKTDEVAANMAEKILKGNIDIRPYKKDPGNKTPCQFCDYTGVCQFEPSVDGNNYRRIKKLSKEELWKIFNEGGED